MRSKSGSRRKFSIKYSDERDELLAYADSCEGKVWIAKSSSGAKGEFLGVQCYYNNIYITSVSSVCSTKVGGTKRTTETDNSDHSIVKNPN